MQVKSFRFNLQELGGALGDLGTLLPLMVALILFNGLNATVVLILVGFWSTNIWRCLVFPVFTL